jgi:transposase
VYGGGLAPIIASFIISTFHGTHHARPYLVDKQEYRRAQAILKKGEGKIHKEIAKEHGVNERTTQRWIAVYAKKGIEGLPICRSSRSKSRITDEDREIILSALFIDPHLFGYLRNTWSLRSLAKCLTNELGVPISFKHRIHLLLSEDMATVLTISE